MPTRPILAAKVDVVEENHLIRLAPTGAVKESRPALWPFLCTPKVDGLRLLRVGDRALTRAFKDLPNAFVRQALIQHAPSGLDGELIIPDVGFHETQSALMSYDGEPSFEYWVFDYFGSLLEQTSYHTRLQMLYRMQESLPPFVKVLPTRLVYNATQLLEYESECLANGFEGICGRTVHSEYKSGRSTLTQQYLWKLKRFKEAEALIIGYEELQRNENPAEVSELGLLRRGKAMANMVAGSTLGALVCRTLDTNVEFKIGTGFTSLQRDTLWAERDLLPGKLVTYKSQPYGALTAPRCPVFRGIRYDLEGT